MTLLDDAESCPESLRIAYLYKTGQVRLRELTPSEPALVPEIDTKARKVIAGDLAKCANCDMFHPTDAAPKVLAFSDHALLVYSLKGFPDGRGFLFYKNSGPYPIKGGCTVDHVFFSVDERLHLSYRERGCDSGTNVLHIYDLSEGAPKHVYENGKFST